MRQCLIKKRILIKKKVLFSGFTQEKKKNGKHLIEEYYDIATRSMICWVKGSGTELCRSSQIWTPSNTISTVVMFGVPSNLKMIPKPKFSGTSNLDFLKENGK